MGTIVTTQNLERKVPPLRKKTRINVSLLYNPVT